MTAFDEDIKDRVRIIRFKALRRGVSVNVIRDEEKRIEAAVDEALKPYLTEVREAQ